MKKYSLLVKFKLHLKFILLLSFALLVTGVAGIYFIRYLVKPTTGLVMNYMEVVDDNGAIIFSPRTPFSPAVAAGLIPNKDAIRAINNHTIKTVRDVLEENSRIWSFKSFPVQVLRDGKKEITIYITPELNLLRVDWIATLFFLFVLGFMVYYLVLNHRHETYNIIAVTAGLFFMLFICAQPFYYDNVFTLALIYLGETVSWLLVVFALYFPRPKFNKIFRRGLLATIAALYLIYFFFRTKAFMQWIQYHDDRYFAAVVSLGQMQNISDLFAYILFFGFIFHTYIKSTGAKIRKHLEWLAAGAFITLPTYVFFDQLPFILGETPGQRMGMGSFANFFLAFLPLFYIIGLIKSHKIDLQVLNRRSIISLLFTLIFLAAFAILFEPFKNIFVQSYGMSADVAGFMVALSLFVTFFLLYTFLLWLVERFFNRRQEPTNPEAAINIIETDEPIDLKYTIPLQKEKITELRSLWKGVWLRLSQNLRGVNNSLITLTRDARKVCDNTQWYGTGREKGLETIIQETVGKVRQGTMSIHDFVKKFMLFMGQESAIPISMDLETIISSACEQIRVRIPDINLKILPHTEVKLFCYPEEIIFSLVLLFENAYEALRNKNGVITVATDATPEQVCIEIIDHGIGISEKIINKIFDPFFTRKRGHDGLGLYFCKLLAEKNWGRIEVRSVENKQTSVCLYLSQLQDQ